MEYVERNCSLIGWNGAISPSRQPEGYRLCIKRVYRRGIGKAMIGKLIEIAKHQFEQIELEVMAIRGNDSSIRKDSFEIFPGHFEQYEV